jgi:hypothetical protein
MAVLNAESWQIDEHLVEHVLAAIAVALAAWVVWRTSRTVFKRLFGRRHSAATAQKPDIDLQELAPAGPPSVGPSLEIYHVPARLVVLVLAPVGRGSVLPSRDRWPHIVDQIALGLAAVMASHRTRVILWQPQLSTQGFARALFADMPLPGNRGKGTPWCAVAGRFTADNQAFLAGMILRAASPNNLSQIMLERETQWLELLRCAP